MACCIAYGLHQAKLPLLDFRDRLPGLLMRLQVLQRQGASVAWMLEAAMNNYTLEARVELPGHTDHMVMNAITSEMLLRAGIPLWSSHLPLVQNWILRECHLHQATDEASRTSCGRETDHVDPATNMRMARQILQAIAKTAAREKKLRTCLVNSQISQWLTVLAPE